MSNLIWSI